MSEKILADRYRLVEQIGMGGMAIVYRAIDMRTGHNVAVKVLRPEFNQDAEFVGRFQREAEAASKMTHHNIVNLLDVGMDGENRYLVMEYVQGKTLKELIQEKGRLNPQVAAQVTIRILSALQHAHQNGIIHRDIKPQNILVNADGHVKVADFGIARMADSSTLTRGDSVMGSVHYFSPEQASGQAADARSDIYSCGVVLYEMLTGRVPFDGDSPVAVAMQHLHAKPAPIESIAPDVPQAISHVCMMAMEKNPKYRYQSAMEMAAELRLALEGRTERMQPRLVEAMPIPAPPRPPQRPVGMDTASQARKVPPRRRYQVHPHRTGMWTLLSLIMAGLVFYGLYLGGGAIYERVVTSTTVPDLLGADVVTAQRLASRANLQVEVIEVNHPTVPTGTVILQAPEMDTTLKKGDTVVITVSKGPSAQQVPAITGSTTADAIPRLQAAGLTLAVVEKVVSDQPVDTILTQTPDAGSTCASGDIVQVTVSGGSAYIPNLVGKTLQEARELLSSAKLTLNTQIQSVDSAEANQHGKVALQSPVAGTQVIEGTAVTLSVYRVASLVHAAQVDITLPESDASMDVRITLVDDEGIETEVYADTLAADSPRNTTVTIESTLTGSHVCRVYLDGSFAYQRTVTLE